MRAFLWINLRHISLKCRYAADVFFIGTDGKDELENFMKELNSFHDHLKFTFEPSKKKHQFFRC